MCDFYNYVPYVVYYPQKNNKSFFSMTNTTLEAVNIKAALSFRPGRCVEINLYYKLKLNRSLCDLHTVFYYIAISI